MVVVMSSVSVVIPVYNVEEYLIECLESVVNQTYRDLEIILIDDGSTDGSSKICDSYALKDSRVSVIHQVNSGLSAARNRGIDQASSEYITFIDSDDVIALNFVETLMNQIKSENADIAECDFSDFFSELPSVDSDEIFSVKTGMQALHDLYDVSARNVTAWGKIYKTDLFSNVRYPVGKTHEDVFTTYKLFYFAKKIVQLKSRLYFYRKRSGSITASFNKNRLDILDAYCEINDFFVEHGVNDLISKNWKAGIYNCFSLNLIKSEFKKEIYDKFRYFYERYKKSAGLHNGLMFNIRSFLFNVSPSFDCFLVKTKIKLFG